MVFHTPRAAELLRMIQEMRVPYATTRTLCGATELFRGTASWRDALLDAKVITTDFYGVQVHAGFAEAYRALHLPTMRVPSVVGGYSMGGALALLRAIELNSLYGSCSGNAVGGHVRDVYTFNAPRLVADEGAARRALHGARVWRVRHARDLVPMLPPHLRHVGTEIVVATTRAACWTRTQHDSARQAGEAELTNKHETAYWVPVYARQQKKKSVFFGGGLRFRIELARDSEGENSRLHPTRRTTTR